MTTPEDNQNKMKDEKQQPTATPQEFLRIDEEKRFDECGHTWDTIFSWMTEYRQKSFEEVARLQGELLNALRGIKIRDGDIQRQRDTIELLQERNVKLEGLLRETKTYVEYDRNQAIKYSHPTTLATSLLERITSALSGTEKQNNKTMTLILIIWIALIEAI